MDTSLSDLTTILIEGAVELQDESVRQAVKALLSADVPDDLKANFLRTLASRGESAEEIASFVRAFLEHAVDPELDPATLNGPLIDVCGTGGDRLHLFNVSTSSMFVLAAGGAVVVKHGNRSISSQCGGADVLEALGVAIDLPAPAWREQVQRTGLGFLFAPLYHPTFKAVGAVRRQLASEGVTTIFNLLGPLLNPARPAHQLVGIFSGPVIDKYAQVLQRLGRKKAWVVHGKSDSGFGMDELSTMGPTEIREITPGTITPQTLQCEELQALGLAPALLEELSGGNCEENAAILTAILNGSEQGPKRDLVLLNAAAGFVVVGLAKGLSEGVELAREQISSGRALAKLKALQS